jgi:hypothetical protein
MALAKAAYDKETGVRRTIINSLTELGRKQPNLLLSTCLDFLMNHRKVVPPFFFLFFFFV